MFHLPFLFFWKQTAVIFPFQKIKKLCIDSCMLKSCCWMRRVRVPRAERAGTRACVCTERTDGWTDGKHSGTHTHGSAGAKGSVHGGAGTPRQCLRVRARAAGALAQQAKARARLPARPMAWAHSPQGMGWGSEGG